MIEVFDWNAVLEVLTTLATGGLLGWLSKSGRVKAKADAFKAMEEAYEFRIKALHEVIETCNRTIKELQERIAELNHALDDKTDQIRKYVAELMKVQSAVAEKEREIAELRVALEYVLEWRCEHPDCNDLRGRRPPNGKLSGQSFCLPAIVSVYREKAKSAIKLIKNDHGND